MGPCSTCSHGETPDSVAHAGRVTAHHSGWFWGGGCPIFWGTVGDTGGSPQLEEQLSRLQREKNEVQSRLEEDQEDMNELMKKHKAAVAQVRGQRWPWHPRFPITPLSESAQRDPH